MLKRVLKRFPHYYFAAKEVDHTIQVETHTTQKQNAATTKVSEHTEQQTTDDAVTRKFCNAEKGFERLYEAFFFCSERG